MWVSRSDSAADLGRFDGNSRRFPSSAVQRRGRSRYGPILLLIAAIPLQSAAAQSAKDLADLSLEELSNIEVTSVSRRAERLADAAASVFVISSDDIRRAGVTSLPEALRLAPNLQVARTNANSYAISARGFNNSI